MLIPSPQVAEAGHESLGPAVAGGFVPERAVAMNLGAGQFRASKVGAGASSPSPSLWEKGMKGMKEAHRWLILAVEQGKLGCLGPALLF